jgi:cobalamin biosynthesis protein CobT
VLVCALADQDLDLDDFTAEEDVQEDEQKKDEEQGKKPDEKKEEEKKEEKEEKEEEGREEKEPSLQEGIEEAAQPSIHQGLPQQIIESKARVVVYEENVGFIGRNSSDVDTPRPFKQHKIANIGVYVRHCFNNAAAKDIELCRNHSQMVSEANSRNEGLRTVFIGRFTTSIVLI